MVRRIFVAVLPVGLGVLLALGAVHPAHAALPPGDSADWSIPPTSPNLASCAGLGLGSGSDVGGWDRRGYFLRTTQVALADGAKVEPVYGTVSEPCIGANGRLGLAFGQVAQRFSLPFPLVDRYGQGSFNLKRLQCINSSGMPTERTTANMLSRLLGESSQTLGTTLQTQVDTTTQAWITSNCARLWAIDAELVVEYNGTVAPYTAATPIPIRWQAALFLGNEPYDFDPPVGFDPDACETDPGGLLCENFADPVPVAWVDTCGEQANSEYYGVEYATFNPVDPATWGPAVAWLGACLFVPLETGGPDRDGVMAAAWEASPNVLAAEGVMGLAASLELSGTCGVLVAGPADGPLPNFVIDSCDWGWAPPIRAILGLGVLLASSVAFVLYVFRAPFGVFFGHLRSPVDRDGDDD